MPEAGKQLNNPYGQDISSRYTRPDIYRAAGFSWPLGRRTLIMGILNVTPDSFFPGSRTGPVEQAIKKAEAMLGLGADIIDVGGESTRPGSEPLSLDEEMSRVIPVVAGICRSLRCPVSIDTYKPDVAREALRAGACMVNDIMGLQGDPAMPEIVASNNAGIIIMHNARLYRNQEDSRSLARSDRPEADIIVSMQRFFNDSLKIALQAGLGAAQIVIDPGIGFGVSAEESIRMIAELEALGSFNLPILVGPSRKRFIGHILDKAVEQRLHGTSAAVALSIARGADIIRVHDVAEQADVVKVADAICRGDRR